MLKKLIVAIANANRKTAYLTVVVTHFLLTFVWERFILILNDGYGEMISIPLIVKCISTSAERIITYTLSKTICFLLLLLLWYIIFFVLEKMEKKLLIPIILVFVIGILVCIITYPDNNFEDIDNYTNYLYAIRLIPTYWQHVITGAFYAGCCIILPHPIAIPLIQWSLLVSVLGYIMQRFNSCFGEKYYMLPLIILLLPDTFYIAYNPYRNDLYTILTLFYIAFLYFDIYIMVDTWSIAKEVLYIITTALIISWRSEGIIIGFLGLIIYCVYADSKKQMLKKKTCIIVCTLLVCLACNRIQHIGELKYYGKDYSIVNTASVLSEIFNNPNANLSYENAAEDIDAINAIVSVEVLKEQGLDGLRSSNWSKGHEDFNQTLASAEEAKNYMSAYYNIIAHNLKDFFNVQLDKFFISLGMSGTQFEQFDFEGERSITLPYFQYTQWEMGKDELLASMWTKDWQQSNVRQVCYTLTDTLRQTIMCMLKDSGLLVLIKVGILLLIMCICIAEFIKLLTNYNRATIFYFLVSFFIILQYVGIILFMPVARDAYLYPIQYASGVIICGLFCEKMTISRDKTYES